MKKVLLITLTALMIVTSCKKDDVIEKLVGKTIVVNATSQTEWVYFSFVKDTVVTIADAANSTDWDIAFQRNKVRTNSGKSGKGNGGAFRTSFKSQAGFDSLVVVPADAVFATDDSVTVYGPPAPGTTTPTVATIVLNAPLYDWYTMISGPPTILEPKNDIYVVRTALGNYAKLWIESYYSKTIEKAPAAYFTLVYAYQKDGSKNIE